MRIEQFGDLRARVTGGTDGRGGGDGPVVVLMHGFGAPGDDLVPLAEELALPRRIRFVFPEAPLVFDMGFGESRAWWMVDLERMQRAIERGETRDLAKEVPEGLDLAREKMSLLLDRVAIDLGVPGTQLVLGGFSQGAMLACDVALRAERRLAGLILLSGTLVAESDWSALMPLRRGLRVFQSHGRLDPLLPFSLAERLRELMRASGMVVEWTDFQGGHEIPRSVLTRLGEFVRAAFPL